MIVDVRFPVLGTRVPTDHGYLLYGAVTAALPALHEDPRWALHSLRGDLLPQRELQLTDRSALVIRVEHTSVPHLLTLAGRCLRVGRYPIRVGTPVTRPLRPSVSLGSRLVVIKGFMEAPSFLDAARRQVDAMGISAELALPVRRAVGRFEGRGPSLEGPIRRTLRIRDREVVGFAVRAAGLSESASITLQERGLGGRQRFGCGVMVPVAA